MWYHGQPLERRGQGVAERTGIYFVGADEPWAPAYYEGDDGPVSAAA